jgi:cytochrome c peroxidase
MRAVHVLFTIIAVLATVSTSSGDSAQSRSYAADSLPTDACDILVMQARAIFGVLPQKMPGSGLDTEAQITLGRMLFFEPNISINRTQSCSTCHPIDGRNSGVDNLTTSPGALGILGTRNAPTVLNAGYQISLFWDGRAQNLTEQAKGPILNSIEMGMPHVDACLGRVKQSESYLQAFRAAYPGQAEPITYDNLAHAIAAFERTLGTRGRFDQFLTGDKDALTAREQEGLKLFMNVGCIRCHSGPLLGGMLYQKVGIQHAYRNLADTGRYAVTKDEADRYVFKVPMLRNVTLTAPYFHDGAVATLAEAIDEMAWLELDRRLGSSEIDSILRFLTSLADNERTIAPVPVQSRTKMPQSWNPPAVESIPAGEQGDLVRYGRQLLTRTSAYLGKGATKREMTYTASDQACASCHQEAGTKAYGIPWMGVVERYPQYSSRTNRDVTLEDRVNDCMERSMNGLRALPTDGREMKAIIAYLTWLSKDLPKEQVGLLKVKLEVPDRHADLAAGSRVYREFCQACHGADGSGYRARSEETTGVFVVPPPWGPGSYNTGAGMHRLLMSAAFVKGNMPLGTPADRPVLTDDQAFDVAAYINSLERPRMPNMDKDWPDLSKKPVDCPYPPYADGFTQDQHQFGPFVPMKAAGKK